MPDLCFTKAIDGFPGYLICKDGRSVSLERRTLRKDGRYEKIKGKILKSQVQPNGYYVFALYQNKTMKRKSVHRLVAEAFLPNPDNKPCVNHINGIKSDNRIENLEWCTYSENEKHSYDSLGKINNFKGKFGILNPNSKKINQIKNGQIVREWGSIGDADRAGFERSCVSRCCSGERNQYKGFQWEYTSVGQK